MVKTGNMLMEKQRSGTVRIPYCSYSYVILFCADLYEKLAPIAIPGPYHKVLPKVMGVKLVMDRDYAWEKLKSTWSRISREMLRPKNNARGALIRTAAEYSKGPFESQD
uniref:Uncharacterized protein n=2 Tax=Oryza sativa subsp. japonica TaxID=39947 RepID=Q75KC7_ORYSJ|nr:hypothetical protein [Oryza sativa Japonica Group]ABF96829.1 hypothetical protein LOC_Os03g32410 [Oryza sativa Japonica Group]